MTAGHSRRTIAIALKRGLMLAAVWAVLVAGDAEGLIAGLIAVPAATWLSLRLLPPAAPLRLLRLAALMPNFLWRSIVGGVDVAWRAFHPRLPLKPGWSEVPVTLPDGGRVCLGGELSLMPGTLVAGVRGDRLLVHALDRDQDIMTDIRREEVRLRAAAGEAPADDEGRRA